MSVKLNKKQSEVFDQLKKFIKNPAVDTYVLNGYAGTGKTTLIQHFANFLNKEEIKFKLLATTGRAAAVLRGKTKHETSTIHGALYSFSKVDGDDDTIDDKASTDKYGQMTLIFEPKSNLKEKCIYIIDEASMLSSINDFDDTSYAKYGSGMLIHDFFDAIGNNKVILVGDKAQLPPVRQDFSPGLDVDWLNSNGRLAIQGTLDEIMRTKNDNDILKIAGDIRKEIDQTSSTKWIKFSARNRNNCKILYDPDQLLNHFFETYQYSGANETIAIAHSNKVCNDLNRKVREKLYTERRNVIEEGEILMVNQNNHLVPLTNGDFVRIKFAGETAKQGPLLFQDVRVESLANGEEYQLKLALDPLLNQKPNLSKDQQRHLMIDYSRRCKMKNIKVNSTIYKDGIREDPYLNSLRASYGYVVTCHKSQGGEWDNVFVFLDSKMYGYMSHNQMRRWWYTAFTRAKQYLYIHDDWWIRKE